MRAPEEMLAASHHVDLRCLTWSARGDGRQGLIRVECGGQSLGLKFFGKKRTYLRSRIRELGHWLYLQRSGCQPEQRKRTEQQSLDLWREQGFATPLCYEVPNEPSSSYIVWNCL